MANYGFESSDEIKVDEKGLPTGIYKIMCVGETDTDEGFVADYEIVDGPNKGRKSKIWYNTLHIKKADENYDTANIAKSQLRRIADATGRPISDTAPLKGRVFTVEVITGKKGYNNISRYYPADHKPEAATPF